MKNLENLIGLKKIFNLLYVVDVRQKHNEMFLKEELNGPFFFKNTILDIFLSSKQVFKWKKNVFYIKW